MNFKTLLTIVLLTLASQWSTAQQTAIYKDDQATFKQGLHFFEQQLFGKAQEEFDKVVAQKHTFSDKDVPSYILQAELYAGLSALYLEQPDAEKRLLYFIEQHEPNPVAGQARLAIGDYYYNQKDYDLAIKYLSTVSKSDLTNDEIVALEFKLGYANFVNKKFAKAQKYFNNTKETKTEYYYPSNYYSGIIAFYDKDYEEAIKGFERADKSSRYSKVIPVYLTQIYFAKGDYDKVIAYGEPIVDDNSIRERQMVEQLLGQAYFEKGMYVKALPRLENYVSKTPKVSKESMYQLAYTQYKTGNFDDAIGNFEELNSLNSKLGQSALYYMADALLKSNKKSPARQAFQRASQMNFDKKMQEDALVNFAKLSYELGFDEEAIRTLQQINSGSSYYGEAQNLMSKLLLNTKDYDNALEIVRKLNPTEPKLKETWQKLAYFRGLQYFNESNFPQALKLFDESLARPYNAETTALSYFWKAESYYKLEQYDASIQEYLNFETNAKKAPQLPANSSLGVGYYGLGYDYIKKDNYNLGAKFFKQATDYIEPKLKSINDKYVTDFVYPDALLRAGDCNLYLRNDIAALPFYDKIINNHYPNEDYAMYQKSMIKGLQNKVFEQVALLDKLVELFPQSLYADDATYTKGNTLLNNDKRTLAIEAYQYLINNYPNSDKANAARLKLGLIAYSSGREEEALNYYKAVFRADPQSEEAQDALVAIKEIYISGGNPDGYFDFVNTVQGFNLGDYEKDSLLYKAAEIKFENRDLEGAISAYDKYLQRFPSGINSVKAHFYKGESLFDLKRYPEALVDYDYVSNQGSTAYAETANHRAANITYYNEAARNFKSAEKYYDRLEKMASTQELLFEAQQIGLRASYFANNLAVVPAKADKLMQNARTTPADHAEANYFKGKALLEQKNYPGALVAFNKNIELSGDDSRAAESRYWRAYITYKNRELDKAMDMCFQINKEVPNHTYWVVKAFILLADIYAEKDNLFQAKATLQSIVDNYKGDQALLDEAKAKLQRVKDAEKNKSKIRSDQPSNQMEMIED